MKGINIKIFFPVFIILFLQCKNNPSDNEEMRIFVINHFSSELGLRENPEYKLVESDYNSGPEHSLYWNLKNYHVNISKLNKLFTDSGAFSFLNKESEFDYKGFNVVYDSYGNIKYAGLINSHGKFTGYENHHYINSGLIKKVFFENGKNFYVINYKIDKNNDIIDSTYYFSPIVYPSIDSFEGPNLSICFDVKMVIDLKNYSYGDFNIFYALYDSKYYLPEDFNQIKNNKLKGDFLGVTTDGNMRFCEELIVDKHLIMAFGYHVANKVSNQDLSIGGFSGSIINTNALGKDL